MPIGVRLFDQTNLPSTIPLLQALLASKRKFDVAKLFVVDQPMYAIFPGKSRNRIGAMFVDSPDQIIRHTDVSVPPIWLARM